MGFLESIWGKIQAQRAVARLAHDRVRLEHQVQRRKEEAARCGISDLLIQIAQSGRDFEPWLTDYEEQSPEACRNVIGFRVCGKPYTLTLTDLGYPVIGEPDAQQVLMTLERLGRIFYEARINRSGSVHGGLFSFGRPWEVLAYLPGNWVEEFKDVLQKVGQVGKEERFKVQHSPDTLDDLRKRFGL